jgi:hypothetical protein
MFAKVYLDIRQAVASSCGELVFKSLFMIRPGNHIILFFGGKTPKNKIISFPYRPNLNKDLNTSYTLKNGNNIFKLSEV